MESSSYRTRSVGCRSREPRALTEGPRGPTSPFPPPLNPAGRMLRTSQESRSTRRKLRGADALLRDHLLPRPSPPQYLYQGASLHGGVGEGLRGHAPLRAATPSRASDRTRGYRTPPLRPPLWSAEGLQPAARLGGLAGGRASLRRATSRPLLQCE